MKDWCRYMSGFASDASPSDLLRGWFVHTLTVNTTFYLAEVIRL